MLAHACREIDDNDIPLILWIDRVAVLESIWGLKVCRLVALLARLSKVNDNRKSVVNT